MKLTEELGHREPRLTPIPPEPTQRALLSLLFYQRRPGEYGRSADYEKRV